MFAITCGYEDADDCDALRTDPLFKLAVGRAPESGRPLCSQPTMSRLENAPSRIEVARMTAALVDLFCRSFPTPPEAITLDIDDTCDPVHGHQQLSLFHAHHDTRCFLPVHVYHVDSGKPVAVLLRPGKTPSGVEVRTLLKHLVRRIRRHWPRTRLTFRGDSHYGRAEAMTWCEDNGVNCIFGLAGNRALHRLAPGNGAHQPHQRRHMGLAAGGRDEGRRRDRIRVANQDLRRSARDRHQRQPVGEAFLGADEERHRIPDCPALRPGSGSRSGGPQIDVARGGVVFDRISVRRAHHLRDPIARQSDAVDVLGGNLRRDLAMVGRVEDPHRQRGNRRRERAHGQNVQGKQRRARAPEYPSHFPLSICSKRRSPIRPASMRKTSR